MNAVDLLNDLGVMPELTEEGGLRLAGLSSLDHNTAARVLEVARANKPGLMAELQGDTERTPSRTRGVAALVPSDAPSLVALVRFERDPRGVVAWLAQQGQGQPPQLVERWAAAIRAEARLRIVEAEASEVKP